jgi:hypothetical protein
VLVNPEFETLSVRGLTSLRDGLTVAGAATVTGAVTNAGAVNITNATASSSTTTGALRVTGGVGIGGAINVGGVVNATATTASTSTTTGAAVISGGLGVAGAIYPGGNVVMASGNGIDFSATTDHTFAAIAATGAITRTATNVSDGDTVTLGASTYTFKTALTPANGEVLIGADSTASLLNLARAINNSGGTPGTDYQVAAANASASAGTIAGTVLPITALTAGTAGNSIALSETSAQLSVSAATLLGGRAAGGMIAEVLNDYEVGTWSPRYSTNIIPYASVSMDALGCTYVKVGRLVTIMGTIAVSQLTVGSASGNITITGLPFAGSDAQGGAIAFGQVRGWTTAPSGGVILPGSGFIVLRTRSTSNGNDANAAFDIVDAAGINTITIIGSYLATA